MAVGSFRLPSGGASLIVDFSVDDTTPLTNQTITFTDLTVGAVAWAWVISHDTIPYTQTSGLQNPTFSLLYQGDYTVILIAVDALGNVATEGKSSYITVTLQSIPSANLIEHYKAPQGASPANMTLVSGAISEWSGETTVYDLTQGSATSRPNYVELGFTAPDGTVYGLAQFDGLNDFLINLTLPRTASGVMYLVLRQRTISTTTSVVSASNTAAGHTVINLADNPAYRMGNGTNIDTDSGFVVNQFHVARFEFSNSGNANIKINNFAERTIANTGANTPTGFVLGNNNLGTAGSAVDVIECVIYGTQTSGEKIEMAQYLTSKFGEL
jgi:hypothetical protein